MIELVSERMLHIQSLKHSLIQSLFLAREQGFEP